MFGNTLLSCFVKLNELKTPFKRCGESPTTQLAYSTKHFNNSNMISRSNLRKVHLCQQHRYLVHVSFIEKVAAERVNTRIKNDALVRTDRRQRSRIIKKQQPSLSTVIKRSLE